MCPNARRFVVLSMVPFIASLAGCQSIQLEHHTIRQSKTLTDLQYKLVLDNLAMLQTNAGALPFFSAAGTGQTNVQQAASASISPSVDLLLNPFKIYRYYSDKFGYGFTGSQTNLEQWTTASVLNPDELVLMRCAYLRTLGCYDATNDPKLFNFFSGKPEVLAAMQKGWLRVGCDGEKAPHDAAYVGHYGHQYVWVTPAGVEPLTRLTLGILDIATAVAPNAASPHIDTKAARIKDLEDRLTALVGVLDKYPGKNATGPGKAVQAQIDLLLARLLVLERQTPNQTKEDQNKMKADIAAKFEVAQSDLVPMGPGGVKPQTRNSDEAAALVDTAIKAEEAESQREAAPSEPGWRPRKNLYNPTAIPLGVSIP
jgi:hypothetical protein